jgi:type I restriction enzyme, S subunit
MAPGELVFARTGASVGKSYLYNPRDGELIYAGFLINVSPDPALLNPKFLSLIAQTKEYWDWIARTSVRSGQPGVNGREYATFPVPLPEIAVQNAIAVAMTDVDSLIAHLERLLAKKRAIKQGVMQRLLTGQDRLRGFSVDWRRDKLGDLIPLQRGFDLPGSKVQAGRNPVVYSNGVMRFHSVAKVKGPGVVTGRSGTIGAVHFVDVDYWPHNTTLWVTSFARVDARFAYYFLTHLGLERFASGSGVPTFNRNDALGYEVSIPRERAEQESIARVLTDIDSELGALQGRFAKAQAVKRGMMQELLTGRTRLSVKEVES